MRKSRPQRLAGGFAAWFQFRPLDALSFFLVLTVIALLSVQVYAGRRGASAVHLQGPAKEWYFPLNSVETVAVPGPLGDTIVEIKSGKVRVISSPCAEKICIKMGSISRPGQWIACLPNRVFIDVKGGSREPIDAFSF